MSAVKGKDCWGNHGSNAERWHVCCLHWCHQPELAEMASVLALSSGNGSSRAAQAAVTACQRGTGSKRSFFLLPFAFSRTSTVSRKAQPCTNTFPYFSLGVPASPLQKQSFAL